MKKISLLFPFLFLSLSLTIAQSNGSIRFQFKGEAKETSSSVVYLVRHAEKATAKGAMMKQDPPLTSQGKSRAQELARVLKDAEIQYVYSSDYQRTKSTAQPLADLLGLEVILYNPRELGELATIIQNQPGRYLIVGHSNSTPNMVEQLGGDPGTPIDDATEYDRLYTLVLQDGAKPVTVMMRYGASTLKKKKK